MTAPAESDATHAVEAADLAEMFRLLGDPTRVRILLTLLEHGELCVGDVAAMSDASETNVSQAMRLLRAAGVVRRRRDGRNVRYRLDDDHVRRLLELSRTHLARTEVGRWWVTITVAPARRGRAPPTATVSRSRSC